MDCGSPIISLVIPTDNTTANFISFAGRDQFLGDSNDGVQRVQSRRSRYCKHGRAPSRYFQWCLRARRVRYDHAPAAPSIVSPEPTRTYRPLPSITKIADQTMPRSAPFGFAHFSLTHALHVD